MDQILAEPLVNITTDEDLGVLKNKFLQQLSNVNRIELELMTREQAYSQDWLNERKKR